MSVTIGFFCANAFLGKGLIDSVRKLNFRNQGLFINSEKLLSFVAAHDVDIIVLGNSDRSLIKELRRLNSKLLIVCPEASDCELGTQSLVGADCFYSLELEKSLELVLLTQLKSFEGGTWEVKKDFKSVKCLLDANLTATEEDVLRLLCQSYTPDEIALRRKVSPKTVANNIKFIRDKLHGVTSLQLVAIAFRSGFVTRTDFDLIE